MFSAPRSPESATTADATRGVRIVNLDEGDTVAALAVLRHEDLTRGIDGVESNGSDPAAAVTSACSNTGGRLARQSHR